MLKGDVFVNQHFPVNSFSAFIDTFLNGECGIKNGYGDSFEPTHTEDTVTISSGLACIKGRFFREDSSTTLEFSSVGLVYCSLIIEIDLSKTNTRETLNQLTYKILSNGDGYPELVQQDIVMNETGKYQYELASFLCNSNGISGFVDKRTYLDFASIYESVEEHIREIEEGSIYVTKEEYEELEDIYATKEEVEDLEDTFVTRQEFNNLVTVPIGAIQQFAGSTAPDKYLLCNGQAVSRTTYSRLFNVIGTTYGSGNGSTTFNLPNLQNRIPLGKGTNRALGATGGSETNTITKANLPDYTLYNSSHTHTYTDYYATASSQNTWDIAKSASSVTSVGNTSSTRTSNSTTITVKSGGSGTALNNMQPYIVLNYIIRAN